VRQVIAETTRIAGCPVPHRLGPRRAGDSPRLVGDIAKSRRELGWRQPGIWPSRSRTRCAGAARCRVRRA
jgi:UDP-glucose 4-epimerase